ncbi:hypothetical protein AB6A40_006317 [Gnathostoma spinigerum]|uniref:DRBM domain-containing protein n=1 Tax=Gnathostoma spinigerum TaxID=75299 RepID=A0ABD6EI94_9BILA
MADAPSECIDNEPFTHIEVLKSREPDYFTFSEEEVLILPAADSFLYPQFRMTLDDCSVLTESNEHPSVPTKTYISILNEGCIKHFDGILPSYTSTSCPEHPELYLTHCEVRQMKGCGLAKTKKLSKQLAAKDVLMKLIERDRHEDFGLGMTKEAATEFLNNLMPETVNCDESKELGAGENWVGKVNSWCQQRKLPVARYDIEDSDSPNPALFTCVGTVCSISEKASARTKKAAKTLAAKALYARLEEVTKSGDVENDDALIDIHRTVDEQRANENEFVTVPDRASLAQNDLIDLEGSSENKAEHAIITTLRRMFDKMGFQQVGAFAELKQLISSGDSMVTSVFLAQEPSFYFFEKTDIDGFLQCTMTLDGPNGEKNTFPGFGRTVEEAKDNASFMALEHLQIFLGASLREF